MDLSHIPYILFSDLDNTIIFSNRIPFNGPKFHVDIINQYFHGYMVKSLYDYLLNESFFQFVPVTTRNLNQYRRLEHSWMPLSCHHAMVCNGGVLLEDGHSVDSWKEESIRLATSALANLDHIADYISKFGNVSKIVIDDLMLYASVDDPLRLCTQLLAFVPPNLFSITYDHRKIYCIPSVLSKGNAIQRFISKYGEGRKTIAAGDGLLDISMLSLADIAICSNNIRRKIDAKNIFSFEDGAALSLGLLDILKWIESKI